MTRAKTVMLLMVIQSRAIRQLTMTTFAIMGIGAILLYSTPAQYLGFVPLPWQFWPQLALTLICDVSLTQISKMRLLKKKWG